MAAKGGVRQRGSANAGRFLEPVDRSGMRRSDAGFRTSAKYLVAIQAGFDRLKSSILMGVEAV